MKVKHPFQSAKTDGPNSTLVRPSAWNQDHEVTTDAQNVYLGRGQGGVGPVQELPVVPQDVADNGAMWTAAKVQAYVAQQIANAVAAITPITMGTIVGSINGNMPGFLPLNGSSFGNVGSGANFTGANLQNLYTHIWNVIPTYPIGAGRGASAAADWAALKTIVLPNSAGCTLGAAGVGVMGAMWLSNVGEASHQLTVSEIPAHVHQVAQPQSASLGGGLTGGGPGMQLVTTDPYNTGATGGDGLHNNIQPTTLMQIWWIKY